MFKDDVKSQIIGQVKIYDKESGKVLLEKKNAIHPGNMSYVLASALAGKPTSVNENGSSPVVNWMAFGNGGSNSTTSLAYGAPRVIGTYDQLPITSSNSALYSKTYEQETVNKVFHAGQDMGNGESVPANTAKIMCSVELSHTDYEAAVQAEILKGFQGPAQAGGAVPPEGQPPAGANPLDPTGAGGGNIGIGQAPVPGEQGFSGNAQQQGTPQQTEANGQQQPPMGPLQ